MQTIDIATEAEEYVRSLADGLADVRPGECLYCYLCRVLDLFGCHADHRFTQRWCEVQASAVGWVLDWVRRNGGCCCDCEVVLNVFRDEWRTRRHERLRCAASWRGGRCP